MATKIFVNLPVKDLQKSMAFFAKLGFTFNPQFTDEKAACMVINEHIYTMLLTEPMFKNFTSKEIVDAHNATEVLISLSAETPEEVHKLADAAIAAGGVETRPPMDQSFMIQRSFNDLDGHIWEVFWMDPAAIMPT